MTTYMSVHAMTIVSVFIVLLLQAIGGFVLGDMFQRKFVSVKWGIICLFVQTILAFMLLAVLL